MFSWTGQVFWPEICPGQAFRGQGCEHDGLSCWETNFPWGPLEAKSDFATMFLWTGKVFWPEKCPGQASRGQGCEHDGLFCWETKYPWRPLEAKSGFATMSLWTGQVFWPEKCPGQVPSGLRWEHGWTFQSQKSRLQNRNYRCGYAWKDVDITRPKVYRCNRVSIKMLSVLVFL